MMKQLLLVLSFLFLITQMNAQSETPYVEGELIVQLPQNVRPDDLLKDLVKVQNKNTEMRVLDVLSDSQNILLLAYNSRWFDDEFMKAKVASHPDVILAQFNHYVEERILPNDPSIGTQWHHVDASDNDIDTDLAWDITTGGLTANGDEIVVCVIEGGGSNYNHTDLIANHWTNTAEIDGNGIDDDGNGYVDDVNGWNPVSGDDNVGAGGHGTAVSGMIGAKGNNLNGGAGVNWDVKIMQVGLGSLTESSVISSYEYAYDMRNLYNTTGGAQGAFVVATNASWGIDNANPANYPVWCAYYDALGAIGILNCGATANNNVNVDVNGDMPTGCSSPYMVAVTATNSSDVRTFSGYGTTSIDLGAPGEAVYLPSGGSGYSNTSGTSFASPCVAGAIALMYSAPCTDIATQALSSPQITADNIRTYLFNGVDPVANLATEVATGGRLNVRNSIDLLLGNCGPLPPCEPSTINLTSQCYYDDLSGSVLAGLIVEVGLTENFCDVETVCYREQGPGPFTCIDMALVGATVNNTSNTYFIEGLNSSTTYEVYYTTADGTSSTATATTAACASETPGCTDPDANNFDPAATFDDGSCTYPCVTTTLSLTTDCWGEETSWTITDDLGNVLGSAPAGGYGDQITYTWSQCLEAGNCYTFTINDTYGDGVAGSIYGSCGVDGNYTITDAYGNVLVQMAAANFGTGTSHSFCVTYVDLDGCTDPAACNYTPGATNDDGSCEYTSCLGCTDPAADNYDPTATQDDGSCIFTCSPVTLTLLTDCWGGETSWSLVDDLGNTIQSVASGTLGNQTTFTYDFCLDDGCYTFNIGDTFGDGLAGIASGCGIDGDYQIVDGGGNVLVDMTVTNFGSGTSHTFCISTDTPGCTDVGACNYDPAATTDDGSCEFLSCAGCTDAGACNYDAAATIDDGSCEFTTCAGCMDNGACNYDPTATIDDGSCEFTSCAGCMDNGACNYDPTATIDDGNCEYLSCAGCTDNSACNYDAAATIDDGSCTFATLWYQDSDNDGFGDDASTTSACTQPAGFVAQGGDCDDNNNAAYPGAPGTAEGIDNDCSGVVDPDEELPPAPCPGDFNNDGERNVADLLLMLSDFGCNSACVTDMNGDDIVNTADMVTFLSIYGLNCP